MLWQLQGEQRMRPLWEMGSVLAMSTRSFEFQMYIFHNHDHFNSISADGTEICLDSKNWVSTISSPPIHLSTYLGSLRPKLPVSGFWAGCTQVLRHRGRIPGVHYLHYLTTPHHTTWYHTTWLCKIISWRYRMISYHTVSYPMISCQISHHTTIPCFKNSSYEKFHYIYNFYLCPKVFAGIHQQTKINFWQLTSRL